MPVNSTHPSYDENAEAWQRIRDVLAGDTAIKRAGEKYVPRLDSQTDDEYRAYVERGFFYNATARTVSGYIGMIFRRDPVLQLPGAVTKGNEGNEGSKADAAAQRPYQNFISPIRRTLEAFTRDVDLLGTSLNSYAKKLVHDVVALGRAGTLVDWDGESEQRAYISMYAAESILNWREIRIGGQMKLGLVVLAETASAATDEGDPFVVETIPQIRVLRLVEGKSLRVEGLKGRKGQKSFTEANKGNETRDFPCYLVLFGGLWRSSVFHGWLVQMRHGTRRRR